ncbi:MAG: TetR/AcrR family transcriptional regulator [Deltaproteobacteria bacterium]|nr:TetR/AcrR family transcriptional regulator [Deltaproteobacteria bacterium]
MKSARRSYRQGARAHAAEQTRERILDAAVALFWERDPDDITLDDLAAYADVTLQTVLRKFGSKDAVFSAALEERSGTVMETREPPAPDPKSAIAVLVASYEQIADWNWRVLRHETAQPMLRKVLAAARVQHRAWIESSFASALPARGRARERMIDALFTALDFYVWKLHRRDLGRSREDTEDLMLGLVEAIIRARSDR